MSSKLRASRVRSLRILVEYNWMYLHHLHEATASRLGAAGLAALLPGFRRYGHHRGEEIRQSARGCAQPRDAFALHEAWDAADMALYTEDETLRVTGNRNEAIVALNQVPGTEYFGDRPSAELLTSFWSETLAGIAAGYDDAMTVSHDPVTQDSSSPWSIKWQFTGNSTRSAPFVAEDVVGDATRFVELSRSTVSAFSALCLYTAQSLRAQFDATAEEVVRTALYNFGVERAEGMRAQALREGKPLNMQTWFETIQQRDPDASGWVFRGDTHISPGVFQVTCTYCPMAQVWSQSGPGGLEFGYLYDMEVHRGLVEGFHPGGVVAWEKVKTRGDRVCNFRFQIPELVTKDDPSWAQPVGQPDG